MDPPFSWQNISQEEKEERMKLFGENSTARDPTVSRPYDVYMPKAYALSAKEIYNFEVRPDDIWLVTYKKCGTTWTQEILWNIVNNSDKGKRTLPLYERSPFLERQTLFTKHMIAKTAEGKGEKETAKINQLYTSSIEYTSNLSSQRIIKTHLPFEFLPPNVLNTAKVIYVCRNPQDCCVSFYHHVTKIFKDLYEFQGTFDDFAKMFMNGKLEQGNYFFHLKSAWSRRNHPNLKFVWYEDMKKNPIKEVSDLSTFLNTKLSDDDILEIVQYLDFSNVKERASEDKKSFFRKGIVGDGASYFQGEKLREWDEWVARNLEGTDIKFTYRV